MNAKTIIKSLENTEAKATVKWYEAYYREKGINRNNILKNKGVLFQTLAMERSIIEAISSLDLDVKSAKTLDVGCGAGDSLLKMISLGFQGSNCYGIEIIKDRARKAEERLLLDNISCGDATNMPYEDNVFDLVIESTMFVQITDDNVAKKIADEMIRVTKHDGHIMLIDWRYAAPWDLKYRSVSIQRLKYLFSNRKMKQFRGALVPPIGRTLSETIPSLYFLVQAIFPFLTGQMTTTIKV